MLIYKHLSEFKKWAKSRNIIWSISSTTTKDNFIFHLIKIHGIINSDIITLNIYGSIHQKDSYFISIKDKQIREDDTLIKLDNF